MKRLLLLCFLLFSLKANARFFNDSIPGNKIQLYLDCNDCYSDFLKTEIQYVNYVRNRQDADVQLMVTSQTGGLGRTIYQLFFIGLQRFQAVNDTLFFSSKANSTEDEIRNGLTEIIKVGLVRYVAHSSAGYQLQVLTGQELLEDTDKNTRDPWKAWVFDLNGNLSLDGEKAYLNQNYSGGLVVNKTTENIKVDIGVTKSYGSSRFISENDTVKSYSKSQLVYGQIVKSVNRHCSFGAFASSGSGSFSNQKWQVGFSPALEYNVFPYEQAQRRSLTFSWYLSSTYYNYIDTTIYDKLQELIFQNRLNISLSLKQPWGVVSFSISGSHLLNDASKNHLSVFASTDWHIFGGLFLNFFVGYDLVHDQLSLSKEGASRDELLLHRKEIATSYFFNMNGGLSYRFGSKYNNVVNTRLNF